MTEEFRLLQNQLEKEVSIQYYLATLSQETYSRTKNVILDSNDLTEFSSNEIIRFSSMRPKQEELYAQLYTDILRDKSMNAIFIKSIKTNYTSFSRRIVDLSGILLSAMDFKGDKQNQLAFADLIPNYYADSDDSVQKVTKQWVYEAYILNSVGHILRYDNIDQLREIHGSTFDVNQRIPNGEFECYKYPTMPLISVAARYGSIKCFKFLLMNKALMDEETASMAVSSGNWEIVKICEQSKLSFEDASSATTFHRYELIKWLYKKTHNHVISLTNIESLMTLDRIKDKESMLFTLVRNGLFKPAKFYIFNGVKVNILNDGKTLLQTAREKKNKKFKLFLLQHGALDDGQEDSDDEDETNENDNSTFYFDPKLLNAYDISEVVDNPIYQKAAKVQKLTEDLIKTDNITDLPSERLKWLKTFYGSEAAFVPHFNPNDVPTKETFNLKVEQEFQRQVAKGLVNPEYSAAFSTMPTKKEPEKAVQTITSNRKKVQYTWFPTAEINTAKMTIDSLPHVNAVQRQELHRKFALQVINIISQFDAIGELSDDKITVEQASLLKQTLTDALSEVKKALFKPFGKKLNENREPLYAPRGLISDDRSIKPLRDKTLGTISDEILKSNGKRETSGPDLGSFAANLEEVEQLPLEYRPIPNSQLKKFDYESFDKAVEAAKQDVFKRGYIKTERPKETPTTKRKITVLSTPRKPEKPKATENLEFKPKKKSKKEIKVPAKEERKPVTLDKFMTPEVKFFIAGKKNLKTEERQTPDVSYLDKMFTTRPPDEVFHVTAPQETIPLPKFEKRKPEVQKGNYYLRPNEKEISELLDTSNLFVNEEKPEEHDQLTELWEVLSLHPDSRLLMASRLCSIIVNDSTNDYHFKTIKQTTKLLVKYKKLYKKIKTTLGYDPKAITPEGTETLNKSVKELLVLIGSLIHADRELTQMLGSPLITSKGFRIPEYLHHNNLKLLKLAQQANIDIGTLGVSE
ncbi:hypothetical protein TVAG_339790 [Trichomonas vaginalis G3]|uniref:DUF3447 domain-containing protein n=1 Tax=Trichomonas vaginalis (strain ATCC PRA-98 / G3) TaxID=412133 RepID=A2F160_TRIV3|nr:Ankyrin repeat family [Trichomonas vaginalis G3]EAY01351.1 hypothetical protein TVAG_339790 [Trichomonas vaginalis G3]KAI5516690.1 Ankyrin repeat family [Trichomonas vaginalis G3]|eukprot:XP_001330204.1 hypothetical protein [Trichomonas vaginalis G3]